LQLSDIRIESETGSARTTRELLCDLYRIGYAAHRNALAGRKGWPEAWGWDLWLSMIVAHDFEADEDELAYLLAK